MDIEARKALWMAILDMVAKLSGQCAFYFSPKPERLSRINSSTQIPDAPAWRLVEALSLIMILARAESVHCNNVPNLLRRTGPLHFKEDGRDRYLWAQANISGKGSTLIARPDLIVTSSSEAPSSGNILRVVECKCCQRIGSHEIRAEFGKAVDLKVTSYLIWSFLTPSPGIVEGAKRLGLDLVALGFDTPRRPDLLARPENLAAHVGNTLWVAKREERFAGAMMTIANEVANKIIVTEPVK